MFKVGDYVEHKMFKGEIRRVTYVSHNGTYIDVINMANHHVYDYVPANQYKHYLSPIEEAKRLLNENGYDVVERPKPKKYVRYVNIYPDHTSINYGSRDEADHGAMKTRTGCQRIEFEEGRWDE